LNECVDFKTRLNTTSKRSNEMVSHEALAKKKRERERERKNSEERTLKKDNVRLHLGL